MNCPRCGAQIGGYVKIPDDVPKTGDTFSTLLIVGIAGICLVGIGTCLWLRKKM